MVTKINWVCQRFSVSQMCAYVLGRHILFNDCKQDLGANYILIGAEENNYFSISNVFSFAQVLSALRLTRFLF